MSTTTTTKTTKQAPIPDTTPLTTRRVDQDAVQVVSHDPSVPVAEQFDKLDDAQILAADSATRQALVYKTHVQIDGKVVTKDNLTWAGIKWLALRMVESGNILDVPPPTLELIKPDEQRHDTWFWRATAIATNRRTTYQTSGMAEEFYRPNNRIDLMASRKAASKAERNAIRKQIPEVMIQTMLEESRRAPGAKPPAPKPKPKPAAAPAPEPEPVASEPEPDVPTIQPVDSPLDDMTPTERGEAIRAALQDVDKCACKIPKVSKITYRGPHADILAGRGVCGTCAKIIA